MKSVTALREGRYGRGRNQGGSVSEKALADEISALRRQVAAQENVIEQLKQQALEDPLTGLANRRAFEKSLKQAVSYYRRYGRSGAVLLIDVNDFKSINDTLGHVAGDSILKHIAGLLSSHVRDTDIVARIGGDEFCVILREVDGYESLLKAAELEAVISHTPCLCNDREVCVSVSVGACSFSDAEDVLDLMEKADEAMYQKKEAASRRVINI